MVEKDFVEREEKAAYNQSQNITEFLGNCLGSYIAYMEDEKYDKATRYIERIVDIISAKVIPEEIKKVDGMISEIKKLLIPALASFRSNKDGRVYWVNSNIRKVTEEKIIALFRYVNKLQDKYGYGMVSLDDPRFAVLNR